jgi:hypothetical protein
VNFTEMWDKLASRLASRPANWHTTVRLPDLESGHGAAGVGEEAGYFQVRLTEMFLSDARRWHQEIAPATFFLADFKYDSKPVSQPFFVSNSLLSGLPEKVDPQKLRVRFRDTLVVAPTPYAGGDVALFVGLFQTVLTDLRKGMFSVFEKLFGSWDIGSISQYVKIADKITSNIFECLGSAEVECLLGERLVIGKNGPPAGGYIAFLRSKDGEVDITGLTVREGTLQRNVGGKFFLVDNFDYCLVQIERLAARNDYTSMEFHRTWIKAREKMLAREDREAQALMLECGYQVFASPDLTEDHKVGLIKFYQAKLLAVKDLLAAPAQSAATRAGQNSAAGKMRLRAVEGNKFDPEKIQRAMDEIIELTARSHGTAAEIKKLISEADIAQHLKQAPPRGPRSTADELMRALAAGSVTV